MILLETNKALYVTSNAVMVIHETIRVDFTDERVRMLRKLTPDYIGSNKVWVASLEKMCSIYDMHMDYTKYWRRYVRI